MFFIEEYRNTLSIPLQEHTAWTLINVFDHLNSDCCRGKLLQNNIFGSASVKQNHIPKYKFEHCFFFSCLSGKKNFYYRFLSCQISKTQEPSTYMLTILLYSKPYLYLTRMWVYSICRHNIIMNRKVIFWRRWRKNDNNKTKSYIYYTQYVDREP